MTDWPKDTAWGALLAEIDAAHKKPVLWAEKYKALNDECVDLWAVAKATVDCDSIRSDTMGTFLARVGVCTHVVVCTDARTECAGCDPRPYQFIRLKFSSSITGQALTQDIIDEAYRSLFQYLLTQSIEQNFRCTINEQRTAISKLERQVAAGDDEVVRMRKVLADNDAHWSKKYEAARQMATAHVQVPPAPKPRKRKL